MNQKTFIWIGMVVWSAIFGMLPLIWGESIFSFSGLILNALGGIIGIWGGYKISTYF